MKSFEHLREELVENVFLVNRWFRSRKWNASGNSGMATVEEGKKGNKESYFGKSTTTQKENVRDFEELNKLQRLWNKDKLENDRVLVKLPFWEKFKKKENGQKTKNGRRHPKNRKVRKLVQNLKKICRLGSNHSNENKPLRTTLNRSILTFESGDRKLVRAQTNLDKELVPKSETNKLVKMSTSEIKRVESKNLLPLNFVNGKNYQDSSVERKLKRNFSILRSCWERPGRTGQKIC